MTFEQENRATYERTLELQRQQDAELKRGYDLTPNNIFPFGVAANNYYASIGIGNNSGNWTPY